jgi:hypothetical protein
VNAAARSVNASIEPAAPIQIKVHVRVEGGRWLSNANANRILCRSTRPTDRHGNQLRPGQEPYYQCWRIHKEAKGYIFYEVSHGGGICGHHKSVRALVLATCYGLFDYRSDLRVEVLP